MNLPETERRYKVYKHTVPDGRVYIGMTCNGKIIKTWDCTMDMERALGYKDSAISRCCSGGRPTAYGYVWRYEAA